MSKFIKIPAAILLAAITLTIFWLGFEVFIFRQNVGTTTVRIERGMDVFDIARALKDKQVIKNRLGFFLYVTLTGNFNNLQAGEYLFDGDYALYEVADLVSGGLSLSAHKIVLIPEGFTLEQIDRRLIEEGVEPAGRISEAAAADFADEFSFLAVGPSRLVSLEGFLFPDTYRFEKRSPANVVARRMLDNFENKTKSVREEALRQGKSLYEILILASILEKEIPPHDMPAAAGVLAKRLEAGLPLQVDATLVYGLGRPLRRSDIDDFNSPYNTYKNPGLPPTPISNPSLRAIEAALKPEKNDYWYYLSRRDNGQTIFSRTLEEHNAARAEYLK